MRLNHVLSGALLALTLTFATAPVALAGSPSAADVAAFSKFTLDGDFFAKWQAVQMDAVKDPCNLGIMSLLQQDEDDSMSLEQMAASYDAKPGVHAMLSRHGLTARNYLLGSLTLLTAGMQDLEQQHPGMVEREEGANFTVSDTNMAFYHQHKAGLQQLMQKLGQQQLQANGGKLPDCVRQG